MPYLNLGIPRPRRVIMAEFKDYLRAGPDFDDLDLTRAIEFPRDIDWI